MSERAAGEVSDAGLHWAIVERWEEYEGERRANLLRVAGIALFYLIQLANYHGLDLGFFAMPKVASVDRQFHIAVTALAGAWAVCAAGILTLLRRRVFPGSLKFASTALDLVFLTAILALADGPRSPLLVVYFLLIGLAGLRFSLPLVRFATAGAMLGYLALLAVALWYREELRVPRYYQLIFVCALGLAGVLAGQVIRRSRRVAEYFAARLERAGKFRA